MQTLVILSLGASSVLSAYYLVLGKLAYKKQLDMNEEMLGLLKEVGELKQELLLESKRIQQAANSIKAELPEYDDLSTEMVSAEGRKKPWLN